MQKTAESCNTWVLIHIKVGVEQFTKSTVRFMSRFCGHRFRFGSVYADR